MITKKQALQIANYIFREGTENTTQGNWVFEWEELEELFEIKMDTETADFISETLCSLYPLAILDVWGEEETGEKVIDVNFGMNYYDCDEMDDDGEVIY